MKQFRLSWEASADLDEICEYYALDGPKAEQTVRLKILEACRLLADNPDLGHRRADLTNKSLRFWPVGRHLVIYDPRRQPLEVVRVLDAARDIPSLL